MSSTPVGRRRGGVLSPRLWRLTRALAVDEHRARFWVRHVQVGVVLSEVTSAMVVAYALLGQRPRAGQIVTVAGLGMVLVPAVLAVPMGHWARDSRSTLLFYGWTSATTVVVAVVTLLDGGGRSPLLWMLVLPLTYAGTAYPPLGVVLMGAVSVTTYAGVCVLSPAPEHQALVPTVTLTMLTVLITLASWNQWDAVEQQQLMAQRLGTLADTDELTGCLTRRAFHSRLRSRLAAADEDNPLSLAVLDLDGFKAVNDTFGHAAGDRVLTAVGEALRATTRETDSTSRLGGDEFAVLLPGTSPTAAATMGHRLLEAVRARVGDRRVSASIGIVTTTDGGDDRALDALLAAADALMYQAKSRGGDFYRAAREVSPAG